MDFESELLVFVGSYTSGFFAQKNKGEGIYILSMNNSTGGLKYLDSYKLIDNPSYLFNLKKTNYLFSISETSDFNGKSNTGGISSFKIDKKIPFLTLQNNDCTKGVSPCHISQSENYLSITNYDSENIIVFPFNKLNGELMSSCAYKKFDFSKIGLIKDRQEQGHPHSSKFHPYFPYLFVADLGSDTIYILQFDKKQNSLIENKEKGILLPEGSGPRHILFDYKGEYLYCVCELNSTVCVLKFENYENNCKLNLVQTIKTFDNVDNIINYCAEIRIHPNNKFLYVSNRGHDSVSIFLISENGELKSIGNQSTHGKTPRNFNITPNGTFLIVGNQESDDIVVFKIDQIEGLLEFKAKYDFCKRPCFFEFYE